MRSSTVSIKTIKVFIFLVILLTFGKLVLPAFASTVVDSFIETDTVWTLSDSPYLVSSDVYIFPNKTLTINPGTVIKFDYGSSIFVAGIIKALGTVEQPIYFTSQYDDELFNTDDEETCYDELDADDNSTGVEICESFDWGDPSPRDWDGMFFNSSSPSILENVFIKYATDPLVFYTTDASIQGLHVSHSNTGITAFANSNLALASGTFNALNKDAIVLFNDSSINLADVEISNVANSVVTVFNNSSFTADNFNLTGSDSGLSSSGLISLFNSSNLSLNNSFLNNCSSESCITFFNGSAYLANPVSVKVSNTVFNGGINSAFLSFGAGESVVHVNNSSITSFANYGFENYSAFDFDFANNFWGDASGPHHNTLNPDGTGQAMYGKASFTPWLKAWPPPPPEPEIPNEYFAKITNAPNGIGQMYESGSMDSNLLKTFPNDWVLKVFTLTLTNDGWIKVEDLTDGSQGWMKGGFDLLGYDKDKQTEFENNSNVLLDTKSKRAAKIVGIVNHYYDNVDTGKSLYSSNDNLIKISSLKNKGFPVELLLSIIAQESGGSHAYNNEIVSFDYGHGITQVTIHAKKNFKKNSVDPRGVFSKVSLKVCKNFLTKPNGDWDVGVNNFLKCYKGLYNSKGNLYANDYDNYDHDPVNVKYKQYTNKVQSMFANIKDGLGVLADKYGKVWAKPCKKDVKMGPYIFSCSEISIIKAVWGYNGASVDAEDYLGAVSKKLKDLTTHFVVEDYNNDHQLIEKLAYAGRHRVELKAHSPIEISIKDPEGNSVGLVGGNEVLDFFTGDYDVESERAVVFFPEGDYIYEVVGDSEGGTYGLDVDIYDDSEEPLAFRAIDLPIIPGERHTYKVDKEKLKNNGKDAVTILIDKDGDGVSERTLYSDDELTGIEFSLLPVVVTPTVVILPSGSVPLWALVKPTPKVLGASTYLITEHKEPIVKVEEKKELKNKVTLKVKSKKQTVVKKDEVTQKEPEPVKVELPAENISKKRTNWFSWLWHLFFK